MANVILAILNVLCFHNYTFLSSDCSEGNWANTSDEDHNDDILSDTDTDDEQIDIVQRRAVTNQVFERFARAFSDSLTKAKPRSTTSIVSAKKEEGIITYFGIFLL